MKNRSRNTLAVLMTIGLAACASKPTRIVLLPQDGRPTSIVVTGPTGQEVTLAEPYAQALVVDGSVSAGKTDPQAIARSYGHLLTAIPVSPKSFVLYFATGGNELTPESAEQLPEIGNLVSHLPAAEIIVFGHTDTVGSLETNDALSLRRAQTVRDRLITAGVPEERIVAVGRGKRDLLIATGDEVAEPRNRRVEVKIR